VLLFTVKICFKKAAQPYFTGFQHTIKW